MPSTATWPTRARSGAPVIGRTGILPAQLHEGTIVEDALPYVEAATILMVALIVGLKFRSLGAPALTLATVGIAYLMALRATERLSEASGLAVPDILKPLMVALVLGIVTDYTIFYASTMRTLVVDGTPRVPAARQATAQITPIVVAGGAILAASLASLQVAQLSFFRAVGPGLAVSVLVALAASITLVPAAMAAFGRALYWPSLPAAIDPSAEPEGGTCRSRLAHLQARRSARLRRRGGVSGGARGGRLAAAQLAARLHVRPRPAGGRPGASGGRGCLAGVRARDARPDRGPRRGRRLRRRAARSSGSRRRSAASPASPQWPARRSSSGGPT